MVMYYSGCLEKCSLQCFKYGYGCVCVGGGGEGICGDSGDKVT